MYHKLAVVNFKAGCKAYCKGLKYMFGFYFDKIFRHNERALMRKLCACYWFVTAKMFFNYAETFEKIGAGE